MALAAAGAVAGEVWALLMPLRGDEPMEGEIVYDQRCRGRIGPGEYPELLSPPQIAWLLRERFPTLTLALVGAGALGNSCAWALAGWLARLPGGLQRRVRLLIVDADVVDESNLNRQLLFRPASVGRPKALELQERLRVLLLEGVEVIALRERVEEVEFFAHRGLRPDVIFGCVDSWRARELLNRLAVRTGAILINGGTDPFRANVYSYVPGHTACLDCAFGLQGLAAREGAGRPCGASPEPSNVIPNLIGGALMAAELPFALLPEVGGGPLRGALHYDPGSPARMGLQQRREPCECDLLASEVKR